MNKIFATMLAAAALMLAAPSASAFAIESTGPLPDVPCPEVERGGGGVVGTVLNVTSETAALGCIVVGGAEALVGTVHQEAENTIDNVEEAAGPAIDLAQDGACIVLFGDPDGSDDLPPYSRDLCREIVVNPQTLEANHVDVFELFCETVGCGW